MRGLPLRHSPCGPRYSHRPNVAAAYLPPAPHRQSELPPCAFMPTWPPARNWLATAAPADAPGESLRYVTGAPRAKDTICFCTCWAHRALVGVVWPGGGLRPFGARRNLTRA